MAPGSRWVAMVHMNRLATVARYVSMHVTGAFYARRVRQRGFPQPPFTPQW